jgi:glycosyltransferase involved in cell wall biosynthesis
LIADLQPNRDEPMPPRPRTPAGRHVVLHTAALPQIGGGLDKTIALSHTWLKESSYRFAAACMHLPDDRSRLRYMLERCRRDEVKIWHSHDDKSNLIGLLLRPFHRMKLVTTMHAQASHATRTPLDAAVDRLCLPHDDHVLCASRELYNRARKAGTPEDRCTLLRDAIDHEAFTRKYPADQSPLRREMNTPPGRLVIGAVGRLSAAKNFSDLIRCVGQLAGEGHDLELWIVGTGDQQTPLEQLTNHLNLQDRVKLLDFRGDLRDMYHAMDLFVLPSLREGLPNALLEALAMQVPVVATRVGEIPAVLTDGKTGLLCGVGDREPLTDAMRAAVRDPVLRASLARAGRQLIERRFTMARRMRRVRAIYDSLMRSAAQPAIAG